LSKVHFDIELFRAYAEGYCSGGKDSITAKEASLLGYGAYLMTIECGIRFLTDYLSGDTYFATKYAGHNLVRCRTQFALAKEMEEQMPQMNAIVEDILG
jgi:N-acetylhexosamine 1-kinase